MKTLLLKLSVYAVLLSFFITACSSDDNPSQPSITDIASANPDFSILVTALQITDLAETLDNAGSYTVFAPTNTAFNNFLADNGFASINDVPVNVLKQVLLNHVLATEEFSGDLSTGYVSTLATGSASATNKISMYIDLTSGVKINGGLSNKGAVVTTADVDAGNGVIHIVDGVISLPTVVNHAIANPNFTSLVAALEQANLVNVLLSINSTVFAPTNQAFADLYVELGVSGLEAIPADNLAQVLGYHVVVSENILSSDLVNNTEVETANAPSTFLVQLLNSGPQLLDANNRVCKIILTDVQASNGVIHALDKVLLP